MIGDPAIKKIIREAAEKEEQTFYGGRAGQEWLDALKPLGTDAAKPFPEIAPWLICVFGSGKSRSADGIVRRPGGDVTAAMEIRTLSFRHVVGVAAWRLLECRKAPDIMPLRRLQALRALRAVRDPIE